MLIRHLLNPPLNRSSNKTALLRIDAERMNYFLHPTCDPKAHKVVLGKGLPASPGATTGEVVFTPEEAEAMVKVRLFLLLARVSVRGEKETDKHTSGRSRR